jgi:hypothetical protein
LPTITSDDQTGEQHFNFSVEARADQGQGQRGPPSRRKMPSPGLDDRIDGCQPLFDMLRMTCWLHAPQRMKTLRPNN